jgi:hypothetical protein
MTIACLLHNTVQAAKANGGATPKSATLFLTPPTAR